MELNQEQFKVDFDWRKYYQQALAYLKEDKELRIWGVGAIIVAIVFGGYYGYHWVNERWNQKAQLAFGESHDVYQQALNLQFNEKAKAEDKKELWEQVEIDFKQAFEHNKHSSFAPFFKGFRSRTLTYQGERDSSLKFMREAVKKMGSKNPYRGLYEIGLSFMLLDGSEEEKAEGLKILNTIADNSKNGFQDMALYYLGLYFNIISESEKAIEYWKKIKDDSIPAPSGRKGDWEKKQSPWAQLAKMKLVELGHEKE